jgi:hypothetical protein
MDGSKLVVKLQEIVTREGQFPNDHNIVSKLNSLDRFQLLNVLNGLDL